MSKEEKIEQYKKDLVALFEKNGYWPQRLMNNYGLSVEEIL